MNCIKNFKKIMLYRQSMPCRARKRLDHTIPVFAEWDVTYFLTICFACNPTSLTIAFAGMKAMMKSGNMSK
jgi:hypothetical protein